MDPPAGQTHQHSGQRDVLPTGQTAFETSIEGKQRSDSPPARDRTLVRTIDAGDRSQQSRLPRPVCTDHADHLSPREIEVNLAKTPDGEPPSSEEARLVAIPGMPRGAEPDADVAC